MKFASLLFLFSAVALSLSAKDTAPAPPPTQANIAYKAGDKLTAYEKERCKLDLYLPTDKKDFPTLVWFHGGGLTAGSKDSPKTCAIGRGLAQEGVGMVVVNYRLSPKAKYPAYVEDAASAVAWTLKNIAQHGGDPKRVFVGGHSAGGYLTLLLGMDARHLAKHGVKHSDLAGLIPVSGQVMTHYTVRGERGVGKYSILADDAAPARWAEAKGIAPMLVLWADKEMETRGEENVFLVSLLKAAKQKVTGLMIPNRDHSSVGNNIGEPGDAARKALLEFINAKR
ncbi:MAG: alpha/beta hydrolase [Prosthecobacter sp.]